MLLNNFRDNEFILLGEAVSLENAIKYIYEIPIIRTNKVTPSLFNLGIPGFHTILLDQKESKSNELYKLIYKTISTFEGFLFAKIIPKRNDEEIKHRMKEISPDWSEVLPIFESDCDNLRWNCDSYSVGECGEYPYVHSFFCVLLLLILSDGKIDFRFSKECNNFKCSNSNRFYSENCSNKSCKIKYLIHFKYSKNYKFGTFSNFYYTWRQNIVRTKSYFKYEENKFMKYEKIENEKDIKISEIIDLECIEFLKELKIRGITTNYENTFEDGFNVMEEMFEDCQNLCSDESLDEWNTYTDIPISWVEELKKYNDINKNSLIDYNFAEKLE